MAAPEIQRASLRPKADSHPLDPSNCVTSLQQIKISVIAMLQMPPYQFVHYHSFILMKSVISCKLQVPYLLTPIRNSMVITSDYAERGLEFRFEDGRGIDVSWCLICPNIAVTSPHPSSFAFRSLLIPGATIEEAGESLIKIREAISSGLNFANADIARGDTELL